jgi:NADH-quinone oxidoreductase subunit C
MDQTILQQSITQLVPEAEFKSNSQFTEAVIPASRIHETALVLKNNSSTKLDFLFCQTGIDLNGQLGVVYHLRSTELGLTCVLKIFTGDRQNPNFDSVADIWKAAEFFEREIFDLYGIKFNNHPDLRRIFLEDDYQGFPLRKDFADPINIIER